MQLTVKAGFSRLLPTVVATLALSAAAAIAAPKAPSAVVNLNTKAFGHGVSLSAKSQGAVVAAPQYLYSLVGTCEGTEDLAAFAPKGTSLAKLLDSLLLGSSSRLVGLVPPPKPPSKSSIKEFKVNGSKTYKGLGKVTLTGLLRLEVPPSGLVNVQFKDVKIESVAGPVKGVIKLGPGSTLKVTAPARIFCKVAQFTVSEDAGSVNVLITRTGDLSSTVTLPFTTEDGKAKAGVDYIAKTGSIVFGPKEKEKTVTIDLIGNTTFDTGRFFRLKLTGITSNPVGAYFGDKRQTTIQLSNDDPQP